MKFTGRALGRVDVGGESGNEVAITGSGYVIGDGNVDERDPGQLRELVSVSA